MPMHMTQELGELRRGYIKKDFLEEGVLVLARKDRRI